MGLVGWGGAWVNTWEARHPVGLARGGGVFAVLWLALSWNWGQKLGHHELSCARPPCARALEVWAGVPWPQMAQPLYLFRKDDTSRYAHSQVEGGIMK